ncbi:MAG: response regulator [Trichocoleus desertorum ATA4-8-CV12]|jgi:CheY-like chemotaxis protein|nr:response regulator [Trichocoleus desertorum ATA4-8-CV12]
MFKIAVLDDDPQWGFAIQRFFRNEFAVSTYVDVYSFLSKAHEYDLAIVDFSIPPARFERNMNGCELICQLKNNLLHPPILILATGFLSQQDIGAGRALCPEADGFLVKDMGLDAILQQSKQLLATKAP